MNDGPATHVYRDPVGHRDTPGSWSPDQLIHSALVHAEDGDWAAATALATIASAMVFQADAEDLARQMVEETLHAAEVQVAGSAVAMERLAEATRILQKASQSGPRHPAIHAALAVLTGESSLGTSEPRSVQDLTAALDASLDHAKKVVEGDNPG